MTGVTLPVSRSSRRTARSSLFWRARKKKTIRWLTAGDSAAILTERPNGPIQRPLFGPPTATSTPFGTRNGLRVSEATGADIEQLGLERGHRTLTITRKGGKVVTIPLAPRTARAIDLAIGERSGGSVFLAADGRRLDRHGAGRIVRRIARQAGTGKAVTPHTLRHVLSA